MTKIQMIERLDSFTRAYITALLWTTNEEEFPEYCYSGEFSIDDSDIARFEKKALETIIATCIQFQQQHEELLLNAGDDEQNGHDFALSRNGHGTGFWDRGYGDIGDKLHEASKKWGSIDLYKSGKMIVAS